MKLNNKLFFVLAFSCFTIALGYVGFCLAQQYAGQQCVWIYNPAGSSAPGVCNKIGGTLCAAGASNCTYCNVASTIPSKTCVPMEGQTCLLAGGAVEYCAAGIYEIAHCDGESCKSDGPGTACGGSGSTPYYPCL